MPERLADGSLRQHLSEARGDALGVNHPVDHAEALSLSRNTI